MYTTAIVPTGKYFIALGSMDGIVFSYWMLLIYIFLLVRFSFYILRIFFTGFIVN
jgi:hypothetical protein